MEIFAGEIVPDELCRLIIDCSNRAGANGDIDVTRYHDTFMMTSFPPDTFTPFSHFVGCHRNKLVIISGKPADNDNNDSPSNNEVPFSIKPIEEVSLGSPLSATRSFLNSSSQVPQSIKYSVAMDTAFTRPLSADMAKFICSCYAVWIRGNHTHLKGAVPDVWVLCDQSNITGKIAIGCTISSDQLFTYYEVCVGDNPIDITNTSYVPFRFNSLIPNRKKLSRIYSPPSQSTTSTKYVINMSSGSESEGSLSLEFLWKGNGHTLAPPPLTPTEAIISIQSAPGQYDSPISSIFDEILCLLNFAKISSSLSDWSILTPDDENVIPSSSLVTLKSKIPEFFNDLKRQLNVQSADVSIISPAVVFSHYQPRTDLDFLDKLWLFVKQATNIADLIESLGVIFNEVLLGRVQPFIHSSKKSSLAILLRKSLFARTPDERGIIATKLQLVLSEERVLQSIVEVGIEKMQADYISYFVGNSYLIESHIKAFFIDDTSILHAVYQLCSLHCVLELTTDLTTYLNLSSNSISSFITKIVDYYKSNLIESFGITPLFHLPISSHSPDLKSLIEFVSSLPLHSSSTAMASNVEADDSSTSSCLVHCCVQPLLHYIVNTNANTSNLHVYYAVSYQNY
jgi:hypothetical protein